MHNFHILKCVTCALNLRFRCDRAIEYMYGPYKTGFFPDLLRAGGTLPRSRFLDITNIFHGYPPRHLWFIT